MSHHIFIFPTIKKIEYSGTQHIQNEYSTTQLIQIPQIRWSFQKVTNFSGNRGRRVDSFQASDWPAVTFPVISLVAAVNSHQSTRSISYIRKYTCQLCEKEIGTLVTIVGKKFGNLVTSVGKHFRSIFAKSTPATIVGKKLEHLL